MLYVSFICTERSLSLHFRLVSVDLRAVLLPPLWLGRRVHRDGGARVRVVAAGVTWLRLES